MVWNERNILFYTRVFQDIIDLLCLLIMSVSSGDDTWYCNFMNIWFCFLRKDCFVFFARLFVLSAMILDSSFDGKLLVPQWIMIWLGDNLMVGFMWSSIHCVLAPPKERTTTWWLLLKEFGSLLPNTLWTIESLIIVVIGATLMLDLLFLSDELRVTVKFLCGCSSFLVVFKLCGDVTVFEVLVSCVS